MTDTTNRSESHRNLVRLVAQNNWDYANPDHLRAYVRHCFLDYGRREKAKSDLASLTDRGIDLTLEEERDLRAYANQWDVSFDKLAEEIAAAYTVIGDRTNTKFYLSLAKRRVIPRNNLARVLKNLIYMDAMWKKGRQVNA